MKKIIFYLLPLILFFSPASPVLAQLLPLGSRTASGKYILSDFIIVLLNIYNFIVATAGSLALLAFVIGGTVLLVSSGNQEIVAKGKKILSSAIIGLIITLFAFTVVDFSLKGIGYNTQRMGLWYTIKTSAPPAPAGEEEALLIGSWKWDPGIEKQAVDADAKLVTLLNCMREKMPANVGRISSISDSAGLERCQTNYSRPPCAHLKNSCHYGYNNHSPKSLAVDLGDEENSSYIISAAQQCGGKPLLESTHVHVSTSSCPGR